MKLALPVRRSSLIVRSVVLSTLMFSLFGGCTSDDSGGDADAPCSSSADCGEGEFCSSVDVCHSVCDSCGDPCSSNDDCPLAQYCTAEKECQQDCVLGADECPDGLLCNSLGKCSDNSIVPGTGGKNGDGGEIQQCIDVEVDFAPLIPSVVLLIDASHSMTNGNGFGALVSEAINDGDYTPWNCSNPNWRWNVVRNVLLNPTTGVVKPLESVMRFGLTLYTSKSGTETCPMLDGVDIAFKNQAAMLDAFVCDDVRFETPTRESLTVVANNLAAYEAEGPKMIVLATDGEPDTCACKNWISGAGPTCECTDENRVTVGNAQLCPEAYEKYLVVQEAKRIHEDLGIQLEVINLNAPASYNQDASDLADHLNEVALAGGAQSGKALDGFDPVAISEAFQSVIDGVRSCAIDLDGTISNGKQSSGKVLLDGEALILNDSDGWRVNSPTQIELLGAACETIKSGEHELDITFPCDAFISNPR